MVCNIKFLEKITLIGLGILGEINSSDPCFLSRRIKQLSINSPLIQTVVTQKIDVFEKEMLRNGLSSQSNAYRYWNYLKKLVSSSHPLVRVTGYQAFLALPLALRQELIPLAIDEMFSEISSIGIEFYIYFLDTFGLLGQEFSTERIANFLLSQFKNQRLTRMIKFTSADALAKMGERMFPYLIKEIEGEAWKNPEFQELFAYLVGQINIKNSQDQNWKNITQKVEELINAPVRSETDKSIKFFAISSILILAQQNIDFVKRNFDLDSLYSFLISFIQKHYPSIDLVSISLKTLAFIFRNSDGEDIKKFLLWLINSSHFPLETKKVAYYCLGELGILDKDVLDMLQNIDRINDPELRKEMAVTFYKLTYQTDKFYDYLFKMLKEKEIRIRIEGIKGYTEIGLWLKRKDISPESIERIMLGFIYTEKVSDVQREMSNFLGNISRQDNLEVLRILNSYTYSSSPQVLNESLRALGKLKPRELFILDRIREIARFSSTPVFERETISLACQTLGEIGLVDFINLGILLGQIENSKSSFVLSTAAEAMVKLLSSVLEKELSFYVKP